MQISRKFLLFAVSIASINQRCSSHNCSTPLRNKVAYEGSSASFEREYNAEIGLWTLLQYSPNSAPLPLPAEKLANDDGSIADKFVGTYAVNQSQLTVLNSTVVPQGSMPYPTAGLYMYTYEDMDCLTAACLIVIRRGPVCTSTPDTLFCQVDFMGCEYMQINPIMTWKDNCGTIMKSETPSPSSSVDGIPGLQRSISTFSVTDSGHELYQCQLTFSEASSSIFSNFAMHPPDFSASCNITRSSNTSTVTNPASNYCSGENLKNTVVYEGVATTLQRSYNGQWQVIPASMSFSTLKNITDTNDHMNAEFCSTYSVSRSNLTIFNSTLAPQGSMPYSTAGLYILRYPDPNCTIAANVIVIRSGPVCACNATNPNNVTLSCSVFYAESSVQPSNPVFIWSNYNGAKVKEQQPIPRLTDRYTRNSMSQLSISSNDATTYECQMTFSRPPKSPFNFINLNAPDFKASCSVSRV